jgi:hypothetical protein
MPSRSPRPPELVLVSPLRLVSRGPRRHPRHIAAIVDTPFLDVDYNLNSVLQCQRRGCHLRTRPAGRGVPMARMATAGSGRGANVSTSSFDATVAYDRELHRSIVEADISESFERYLELLEVLYDPSVTVAIGDRVSTNLDRVSESLTRFAVVLHVMAEVGGVQVSARARRSTRRFAAVSSHRMATRVWA